MVDATDLSRRTMLLIGGTGAAAGTLALVACAPDAPSSDRPADGSPGTDASAPTPGDETGGAGGAEIASLSEVPVGGSVGVEIDGNPALLAQPEPGRVVAFSAICTHQGCVVAAAGERFECPCHGSVFDAATGDVVNGPALEPLPAIAVHVDGDRVVAGA